MPCVNGFGLAIAAVVAEALGFVSVLLEILEVFCTVLECLYTPWLRCCCALLVAAPSMFVAAGASSVLAEVAKAAVALADNAGVVVKGFAAC